MEFGEAFLLVLVLLFFASIPVAILIIRRKFLTSIVPGDTLVIHHDGNICGGKVIGNLISKELIRGRLVIKYLSRDVDSPEVVTIVSEPNKVIARPKGIWSKNRNILEVFPDSAVDYISNILTQIEDKSAESHIINAQKIGLKRQQQHLQDMGEGEISSVNLGLYKDFMRETLKSQAKDEHTKRTPFKVPGEGYP